eukprot:TRINITY_DN3418_c0_g1_i1.p1 TRINITY_DN3418_c0_g1~~TRINITY_DN3418_c0_g1_i1.p1  ORF type:complete len:523 (-),score=58.70 TRINITY_DN3418_c0_g1_i1:109-1677(-)
MTSCSASPLDADDDDDDDDRGLDSLSSSSSVSSIHSTSVLHCDENDLKADFAPSSSTLSDLSFRLKHDMRRRVAQEILSMDILIKDVVGIIVSYIGEARFFVLTDDNVLAEYDIHTRKRMWRLLVPYMRELSPTAETKASQHSQWTRMVLLSGTRLLVLSGRKMYLYDIQSKKVLAECEDKLAMIHAADQIWADFICVVAEPNLVYLYIIEPNPDAQKFASAKPFIFRCLCSSRFTFSDTTPTVHGLPGNGSISDLGDVDVDSFIRKNPDLVPHFIIGKAPPDSFHVVRAKGKIKFIRWSCVGPVPRSYSTLIPLPASSNVNFSGQPRVEQAITADRKGILSYWDLSIGHAVFLRQTKTPPASKVHLLSSGYLVGVTPTDVMVFNKTSGRPRLKVSNPIRETSLIRFCPPCVALDNNLMALTNRLGFEVWQFDINRISASRTVLCKAKLEENFPSTSSSSSSSSSDSSSSSSKGAVYSLESMISKASNQRKPAKESLSLFEIQINPDSAIKRRVKRMFYFVA